MNSQLALLFFGVSSATLVNEAAANIDNLFSQLGAGAVRVESALRAGLEKRDVPGPSYVKPAEQVGPVASLQAAPIDAAGAWGFVQKEFMIFDIVVSDLATSLEGSDFTPLAVAQDHIYYEIERLGVLMQTLAERADSFRSLGMEKDAKRFINSLTKTTIKMNEEIFSIAAPQCSWVSSVSSAFEFMNDQFSAARSVWGESSTKFPEPTCNVKLAQVYVESQLSGSDLSSALSSINSWHGSPASSVASAASISAVSASASLSSARSASRSSRKEKESSGAAVEIAPGMVSSFAAMLLALL